MNYSLRLSPNNDGTYDVLINFKPHLDEEFSLEFLTNGFKKAQQSIQEFISKQKESIRINKVKLLVSGALVATLALSSFGTAFAATGRYSMSYLYTGSTSEQIQYVNNTKDSLNTVAPSYFDINADGSLKINAISSDLVNAMHNANIDVVPFLSNHWNRTAGIAFLQNYEHSATLLAQAIEQYNLDGINVDIENVTHNEKDLYTAFVRSLREKVPSHKEVSVAVAANPNAWTQGWHGSYDYTQLAQYADYLMIMAYDEHYQGGSAGPVASIQFVENSIKYALSKTSADKIVVGLPFFGRLWSENGVFNGNGVNLNMVDTIVSRYNGRITFDSTTKSPKVEFSVNQGDATTTINGKALTPGNYVLWFEDDYSIQEKLALVNKYDLKGAGSWALGKEPGSIWNGYSQWLNGTYTENPSNPSNPDPVPEKPWEEYEHRGTVNADILNIRSGMSLQDGIIYRAPQGTKVIILNNFGNGWYRVQLLNGTVGYANGQYIAPPAQ
ncbi:SH3 domain-containing protein, partial [Clostridia bacterium OttesenSCG-928-F22]|nr:SH3 domain-containing protein [Clostridia bacterium OttesenSCG-928-F22]